MSINSVVFSGNLGADAEFKTAQSGKDYAVLKLAVKQWGDKDTLWLKCNWFNVPDFFYNGDMLAKGRKVTVSGRLEVSKYTDRDGNERQSLEVIVSQLDVNGDKSTEPRTKTKAEMQKSAEQRMEEEMGF